MRIKMYPTVAFEDIKAEFGLSYKDYYFTNMVQNGS